MAKNEIIYRGETFTKVKSGNLYLAMSLSFSQLEASTLTVTVESTDQTITNFERDDPIIYKHDGRQVGIFYLQNVKRIAESQYQFSAQSAIGFLASRQHMGGIYDGVKFEVLVQDLCGTVPYVIKSNLKNTEIYGWLPIAPARDNLSQALLAVGAAVREDNEGVLHIEKLWDGISGIQSRVCMGAKVPYDTKVTAVVVTEHQFVPGTEEQELFSGTAQDNDIITFQEPMHSLSATGFTIKSSGANYAVISAGSGTLKGKSYIHNTREITKAVSVANQQNVKRVNSNATLVTLVNSYDVASRMATYYKTVEGIDAPVYWNGEQPGDRINIKHPYGDQRLTDAVVQSVSINMSNVLKAQEKVLVGLELPDPGESQYYDYREMLTADGDWEVPEGVEAITAVCVGGGQGGGIGCDGEGTPRAVIGQEQLDGSYPSKSSFLDADSNGDGPFGRGGESGVPGSGGKVYKVNLAVTAGQSYHVTIGRGGAGETRADRNGGQYGTDTTFGSHSSANGAATAEGYTDPITAEVYGSKGVLGIRGGDGVHIHADDSGVRIISPEDISDGKTTYTAGQAGKGSSGQDGSASEKPYGERSWKTTGNFGGGPAYGESGKKGGNTTGHLVTLNEVPGSVSINMSPNHGPGEGGNATPPKKETIPGQGGSGGNGGGGGGGWGAPSSCSIKWKNVSGMTPGNTGVSGYGAKNNGGTGSDGGEAADGCVILYYKKPAPVEGFGQLMTKDKRFFVDKTGRLVIV